MVQKRILFLTEILWGLPVFLSPSKKLEREKYKTQVGTVVNKKTPPLTLYLNPTSPMPITNSITHS